MKMQKEKKLNEISSAGKLAALMALLNSNARKMSPAMPVR
jgi:hypothetical protein